MLGRLAPLDRRARRTFARDLRRLNDVLSNTPLAGRYWVWGGLLLGWAREGRLLAHDVGDADFVVYSEDSEFFYEAVPALEHAGYERTFEFKNNEGQITQHSFACNHAKYDFFFLFPSDDARERRFFLYGESPDGWVELEGALPNQPLEPFDFLRRNWLKPKQHETILTAEYGDWRTPDPNWDYMDDRTIFARRAWNRTDYILEQVRR